MRLSSRTAVVIALVCFASAGCGGGGGSPRSCGDVADCGDTGRCLGSACVEDAAPIAAVTVPEGIEALALAEFDGSGSSDPDAALGDEIKAYRWSFAALGAACSAPAVTGTLAQARIRFGCAGSYRVSLTVVDDVGKESDPVSADFVVAPPSGSAAVVASADQSVDHRCTGTPRVCTTDGTLPVVSAHLATGVAPIGKVTYRWTSLTPLDAHKRVTFSPSANVANPSVRIEVDESAIAAMKNDWVLRVTGTDEAGMLGEASTRISVKNRPPALVSFDPSLWVPHTFSAGYYRASVVNSSRWTDPDGDPLSLHGTTGSPVCAKVTFDSAGRATIECSLKSDGAARMGEIAGRHDISVRARDPWDPAASSSTSTVTIANSAPLAKDSDVYLTLPASSCTKKCCAELVGTCLIEGRTCSAGIARPRPSVSDSDGDPLVLTWASSLGSGSLVCEPSACAPALNVPSFDSCATGIPAVPVTFTVSDGDRSASGTLTVNYY